MSIAEDDWETPDQLHQLVTRKLAAEPQWKGLTRDENLAIAEKLGRLGYLTTAGHYRFGAEL